MEDKATDPGIIKLKLQQELRNAREMHREDHLEWIAEARQSAEELRHSHRQYNRLVVGAEEAISLASALSGVVTVCIVSGGIVLAQVVQEGDVSGMIITLALMLGGAAGVGAAAQTQAHLMSRSYGDE